MSEGNGHDSILKLATTETETAEKLPSSNAEQEQGAKLDPPQHGFDESKKYIIVKIPIEYGFHGILGYLSEVQDWLKGIVALQRRELAAQQSKLIKPNDPKVQKGLGRFNIFRK